MDRVNKIAWLNRVCHFLAIAGTTILKPSNSCQVFATLLKIMYSTENKSHHFNNFAVISGTLSCRNDNLRWQQSCQNDNLLFSVSYITSTGTWFSNESQRLYWSKWYRLSSPSNGHQGDWHALLKLHPFCTNPSMIWFLLINTIDTFLVYITIYQYIHSTMKPGYLYSEAWKKNAQMVNVLK